MSRGIGEFAIQEFIPHWLAVVIALLTQLGDLWFLGLLLGILYWTHTEKQDELVVVGGITLTGLGLYRGLKELFDLPRPDAPPLDADLLPWVIQPLWELTATASGYGFPSGHATSSTIVYFGLATVLRVGTRRQRFAGAGLLVGVVGFSRVALGVHYLVDIVVGIALGGLLLYVSLHLLGPLTHRQATVTFLFAILAGVFYVSISDANPDAILVLGAALGSFGGWQLVVLGRQLVVISRPSVALRPIVFRGGLALLALVPLVVAVEEYLLFTGSPYGAGGAVGLASACAVILPIARFSERVRRVNRAVRFWTRAFVRSVWTVLHPSTWQLMLRRLLRTWRRYRDGEDED